MRTVGCQTEVGRTRIGPPSQLAPGPSPAMKLTPVCAGIELGRSQQQVSRETNGRSIGSRSRAPVRILRGSASTSLVALPHVDDESRFVPCSSDVLSPASPRSSRAARLIAALGRPDALPRF